MNVERLTILKNYLESYPQEQLDKGKFNLKAWMVANDKAKPVWYDKFNVQPNTTEAFTINPVDGTVEPNFCQTVGCAIGWASTIPEFKEAGLKLVMFSDNNATPSYGGYTSFFAIEKFFGLNHFRSTATFLFLANFYPKEEWTSPIAVAKRISELIELGEEIFNENYKVKFR